MASMAMDKSHHFFPPYPWNFFPKVLSFVVPLYLHRKHGIVDFEFWGLENLKQSLSLNCSVLLTPNHCSEADPLVMAWLSHVVGKPFYYMASRHLFMEGQLQAFVLQAFGAFSVFREGADKAAVKTAIGILVEGKRPLVVFPEGFVARPNDRVRPFLDGVSLIVQLAGKERAKQFPDKPLKIHPIAIRYKLLSDPTPSLHETLDEIEQKFIWKKREMPLRERILKVGEALLTLKELEYFNEAKSGDVSKRLDNLINHLLEKLEVKWLKGKKHVKFFENINALRHAVLEKLLRDDITPEEKKECLDDLDEIELVVQLSCYPADYLGENPSLERMTEIVEQFEADTTGKSRVHAKWKAIVKVGTGIEEAAIKGERLNEFLQKKVEELLLG
jgi:1-acyl-sn-glycerol-3-phosphate acyltransferase